MRPWFQAPLVPRPRRDGPFAHGADGRVHRRLADDARRRGGDPDGIASGSGKPLGRPAARARRGRRGAGAGPARTVAGRPAGAMAPQRVQRCSLATERQRSVLHGTEQASLVLGAHARDPGQDPGRHRGLAPRRRHESISALQCCEFERHVASPTTTSDSVASSAAESSETRAFHRRARAFPSSPRANSAAASEAAAAARKTRWPSGASSSAPWPTPAAPAST